MRNVLLGFVPFDLVHLLGTGKALENARRDRDELARTMAAVDALVGRLRAATPAGPSAVDPLAA